MRDLETVSIGTRFEVSETEEAAVFYFLDTHPERPRAEFLYVVILPDAGHGPHALAGNLKNEKDRSRHYTLRKRSGRWLCECKAAERGIPCYHRMTVEAAERIAERKAHAVLLLREPQLRWNQALAKAACAA